MRTRVAGAVMLAGCLATMVFASQGDARERWGPFRGQVVDLETGQPIAGAVVLAVWWEVVPTPVEGKTRFYDAKEAVTGPDGRFEIPRLAVPFWKFGVQPAEITIFAGGYEWQATVVTPPEGEEFVAPTIARMRALKTKDERVTNQQGLPPSIPASKMRQFLQALNRERKTLGFDPIHHGGVE